MIARVLVFLLALAGLSERADAAVDAAAPAVEVAVDAVSVAEAEAQEEEAAGAIAPVWAPNPRATGDRSIPTAGDWSTAPELRPPRR